MLKYYIGLLKDLPHALRGAVETVWFWAALLAAGARPMIQALGYHPSIPAWVSPVAIGLLLLYGLLRANYQRFHALEEELKQLRGVRERKALMAQIAAFINDGQSLKAQCFKDEENFPSLKANATNWATRLDEFLSLNLGEAYVIRVRNASGLPMEMVVRGSYVASQEERTVCGAISTRLARLEEFCKELSI